MVTSGDAARLRQTRARAPDPLTGKPASRTVCAMVVVTCGDCAAAQLRAAGLATEVIIWRDILHEAPGPAGRSPAELATVRAEYLATVHGAAPAGVLDDFLHRDAALRAAASAPLILWFDANLV